MGMESDSYLCLIPHGQVATMETPCRPGHCHIQAELCHMFIPFFHWQGNRLKKTDRAREIHMGSRY